MKNTILCGDVRWMLATLPDESVNMVCTSPPYWGLRDYGTVSWDGGEVTCDHRGPPAASPSSILGSGPHGRSNVREDVFVPYRDSCGKCGAVRIDNQLGLEATPEEYVANLVAVFREVRRVLRSDGTCWLNLGDSYAGSWGNYSGENRGDSILPVKEWEGRENERPAASRKHPTLKPKDLVGQPWRVAFALQADGWWLRSDIIWSKPNPMPESVTDRPTKSHEYLFLLSKSQTYYYDAAAIAEPIAPASVGRYALAEGRQDAPPMYGEYKAGQGRGQSRGQHADHLVLGGSAATRNKRSVWVCDEDEYAQFLEWKAAQSIEKPDVWHIPTEPYSEAHFATFPTALVKPCILAGCPEGGIVLDPFFGSGTVGLVAARAGRDWLGIELNPKYVEMAERRLAAVKDRLL